MAQGKVVDNLLLTLGLDFSGLDAGFLAADRTIKQNISAINSQKNQIKLQADIDLSRLQGVGSELDKLKVKETALTAQIDAQTAKYRILQGVLEQTRQIKDPQVNTAPMIAAAERNALTAQKELEKLKADLRAVQSQRVQIQVEIEQGKIKETENRIRDSISRMRTQIGNIKLQTEIDISKLTGADAAIQKEVLSQKALNAELAKQEQILRQLENLRNVQEKNYGAKAASTLNTQGAVLQQQQTIAALRQQAQAQAEAVARVREEAARAANPSALQNYQSLKSTLRAPILQVTSALGQLQAATTSTDAAIVASIETAAKFGSAWAAAGVALAAVPVVTFALEKELIGMAKAAIQAGDNTYTLSRRMATTPAEAGKFKMAISGMGIEVDTVLATLQRLDRQWLTAGKNGNAMTKTMQAFGISLTDADGRLKTHHEQMLALSEGFKRAKASGQQLDLQNVLIKNNMGDMVVAIEDYKDTLADLTGENGIIKNGMAPNANEMHNLQAQMIKMNLQMAQTKVNFSAAMVPVAQELIPRVTQAYANLAKMIKDNAATIKKWGTIAGEILEDVTGKVAAVGEGFMDLYNRLSKLRNIEGSVNVDSYINDDALVSYDEFLAKEKKKRGDVVNALQNIRIPGHFGASIGSYLASKFDEAELKSLYDEKVVKGWNKAHGVKPPEEEKAEKVDILGDEQVEAQKEALNLTKETERILSDLTAKGADERIKTLQDETLKKIQAAHSDSERAAITAQNEAEISAMLEQETSRRIAAIQKEAEEKKSSLAGANAEQLTAVDANAAAKIEQVEAEMAAKRKSIIDSITSAEKQAADARAQFNEQVAAQIDGVWRSSLANKLTAIDRERQAWIKKGLDEVKATKWAETQKSQAAQQAAQEMFTSQRKYLNIYRKAIKQGRGIEGASEAIAAKMREEKGIKKTDRTTAGELMGFQQAMQNAQNSLVPILADSTYQGTYKGTKQALVEIIRGTDLTHESPQGEGYLADMQSGIVQATANMLNGVTTSQTQLAGSMNYLGNTLTAASDKLYGGMANLQGAQETAAQNMVEMIRGTEMTLEQPQARDLGTDAQGRKWSDYQEASHEYQAAGMMKNNMIYTPGQGWLDKDMFAYKAQGIGQVAYDMSALKPMIAALTRDESGNLRLNDAYREEAGITTNQQELQVLEAIKGALEQNVQTWQAVDQARDERMAVINPRTGQPVGAGLPPQREYNPRDFGAGVREGNSFNNTFNFELSGSLQDFYEPVTQEAASRLADQLESSMSALSTSY